ncbi:MAG: DUF1648 domain-containing protein, partial [Phycisphaerae bacterium]|nr:DUF1648 domain-containing protein [Phycisphaerae bacterium]
GWVVAFTMARRRVLPHATAPVAVREATLQPRRTRLPGGWFWLGPLIILVGSSIYLCLRWDDIPLRFPTHWGSSGRPDAWADRSPGSVFVHPVMGGGSWLVMLALAAGLSRFTRRIYSHGTAQRRESRFLRISQWILLGAAYWLAMMMGTASLLPLHVEMDSTLPGWFFGSIALEMVLAIIVTLVLIRTGQGGWRLEGGEAIKVQSADAQPVGDRTPDSAWKLGLFYYNPDDPAYFVEKRFGIGWDINWGRPAAWLSLIAILILLTVLPIVLLCVVGHNPNAPMGPAVIETSPAHGASDVDPNLQEIRIRFDQPMDQSDYSISPGGAGFPEIKGDPYWADDRTLVLPVRVHPGRMYEIYINMTEDRKFRNMAGRMAPSAVIDFQTSKAISAPAQ